MLLSNKVRRKLVTDQAFRKRFLKDPKKVLEKQMPKAKIGAAKVTVHENSPSELYLSIPTGPIKSSVASDVTAKVLGEAQTNAQFRKRLIAKPKKTLTDVLGIAMPLNLEIKVFQDTATEIHCPIPPPPNPGDQDWPVPPEPDPWPPFDWPPAPPEGPPTTVVEAWTGGSSDHQTCDTWTFELTVDGNCTDDADANCTATAGCDGLPAPKF